MDATRLTCLPPLTLEKGGDRAAGTLKFQYYRLGADDAAFRTATWPDRCDAILQVTADSGRGKVNRFDSVG